MDMVVIIILAILSWLCAAGTVWAVGKALGKRFLVPATLVLWSAAWLIASMAV